MTDELLIDEEALNGYAQSMIDASGEFSQDKVYFDYSMDIAGLTKLEHAYLEAKNNQSNVVKGVTRDSDNLKKVVEYIKEYDEGVSGS